MQPGIVISFQQLPNNNQLNFYKNSPQPPLPQQPLQQITVPPQTPKQPSFPPPSKFVGTYVIDLSKEVGHGNFSNVYNAIDQRQPNNKLAVKVVNVEILRSQNL